MNSPTRSVTILFLLLALVAHGRALAAEAPLAAAVDAAIASHAQAPLVVRRTKAFVALLDNARLPVRPDTRFVDCFPEWNAVVSRRNRRVREVLSKGYPSSRTGSGGCGNLDWSHTCPDWWSVLALGPSGLAERARARLATARTEKERTFLTCVAECHEAVARLCARWAESAERAGAKACAADLRHLAKNPPCTFSQALQWTLVYDRCQEAEGEDVRSQGPFDRLYLDFYRADLAAGRETRASAKELARAYFDRYLAQGHPNGKNIVLSGYDEKGVPVWNDLTDIALELNYERNTYNPKFTFRYGAKTPKALLEKVARCVAAGRNSFVFLNEEVSQEMFRRHGKTEADFPRMGLIGCYEPAILGREVIASMATRINLAKPIELVFNNGRGFDGQEIGLPCALPADAAAFEREYLRQALALLDRIFARTRTIERDWYEINPAPLFSGTFPLCIERARDAYDGGLDYEQSGCVCIGLGTAADTIAAVRYLVDEQRLVSMAELRDILKSDWKGREDLRLRARRAAPKWGNNDDRADLPAKRLYTAVADHVSAVRNGHGGTYQPGFWSIYLDMDYGRETAATPEGRHAGEPLNRNNSATAGCGREGPTALILSNTKFDLAKAADGHVTDVILPASLAGSLEANVVAVLETFARLKGHCLHINCFDSKVLRDAQAHPERYPTLQVRVCGWNVLWNNLSKTEQDHFIATAEAQE